MRTVIVVAVSVFVASPQTPPPDTEVFLTSLTRQDSKFLLGTPKNISNSAGYDNQPAFSLDGRSIYFTSARGGGSPTAQMDIYRYEIDSGKIVQVTNTPDSEYSATVTPDRAHISVVRVEPDTTQRLWKFPIAGGHPSVVLRDIKPVGYHAWLDANTLALFVLGQPPTLQIADVRTGKATIAAKDIGRSLQRIPDGGVSFVQPVGEGAQRTWRISEITVRDGNPVITRLTDSAPGAAEEFVTWMPDGTLLMAARGSLYAWRRTQPNWTAVAEFPKTVRNVSRMAVSPRGDLLAVVAGS